MTNSTMQFYFDTRIVVSAI